MGAVDVRSRPGQHALPARRATRGGAPVWAFRTLAHAWLEHLAAVEDVKPATCPTTAPCSRSRARRTVAARDGPSAGSWPHSAIYRLPRSQPPMYRGCSTTWPPTACPGVPSTATVRSWWRSSAAQCDPSDASTGSSPRRRRPPRRSGARTAPVASRSYETPAAEIARREEDKQLGEPLRVASYPGLRRGELVALRRRDVRWGERVLVVERALSDAVERNDQGSPHPLRAPRRPSARGARSSLAAAVLHRGGGLRLRYVAARDAAGLPALRFHDLRHTVGALLTRVLDPVTVKNVLGHADLKTTQRYLHAIRASELADSVTRAFSPGANR